MLVLLLWAPEVHAQEDVSPDEQTEEGSSVVLANLPPSQALIEAREAFRNIQFAKLRPLLEPVLIPKSKLESKESRLEARALLGTGLFFEAGSAQGDLAKELKERASVQFLELLREEPDFDLDPLVYPASVVDFFEETKTQNKEELDGLRQANGTGSSSGELQTIYIQRAIRRRNYALNFMPFGIGQFQNGDDIKGTLFGAGQAVALTTNIVSYVWAYSIFRDVGGVFPRDATGSRQGEEATQVQTLTTLMYVSLATFGVLYAWSVTDALVYYEDEELLQLKTLDGPPPELVPDTVAPAPATWFGWSWGF